MTVNKSKRIFYFDALRALAIICVIVVHVYAVTRIHAQSGYASIPSFEWIFSQYMGNCFRIGVDLFLMLAGALSLGRVWTIKDFLSKRIPRIVSPFVFWGLATSIILIIFSYYFGFKYITSFTTSSIIDYIYGAFMSESPGFQQYWFFWMILGTYLIMPIFNKWLLHADLYEAEYFLVFWMITCLYDHTLNIAFPIKLSYFTSPIGLVVLGYYLRYTERKILNNPYFDLALVVFASVLTMYLVCRWSSASEFFVFDRYSLPLSLEVIGVFLLFKNFHKFNIDFKFETVEKIFKRFVFDIAKYSYGIYLVQGLFLCIYSNLLPYHDFYSNVIILFLLILFSSYILMDILNRVPYVNGVIGAK